LIEVIGLFISKMKLFNIMEKDFVKIAIALILLAGGIFYIYNNSNINLFEIKTIFAPLLKI